MAIITSVLTGGDNLHETTSEEVNAVATDFVSEGVVGAITNTSDVAPMTGAYAVNAQGTPDMTVAVTAGVAYVTGTPTGQSSQTLRVKLTANENVTISANSSGSTKYDWIYIDVDADVAADPAVGADDVSDLVTSRSSSSSTDDGTPPTYGTLIAVVTVSNGASSITNGNISDRRTRTGAKPAEGDVDADQLATGIPVQMVSTNSAAVATGTTVLPLDDTIPQNTEGVEFLTLAITPKSTTNILVIEIVAMVSYSVAAQVSGAIFQDSTAGALATNSIRNTTGTEVNELSVTHRMVAGTTSATTFKFRAGGSTAGTITFNGSGGGRLFGAIPKSTITITEYKAS